MGAGVAGQGEHGVKGSGGDPGPEVVPQQTGVVWVTAVPPTHHPAALAIGVKSHVVFTLLFLTPEFKLDKETSRDRDEFDHFNNFKS